MHNVIIDTQVKQSGYHSAILVDFVFYPLPG